jgi:hypothetical protein
MNWDQIEGKWKQSVGRLGKIQQRYGISKDATKKQIDALVARLPDGVLFLREECTGPQGLGPDSATEP